MFALPLPPRPQHPLVAVPQRIEVPLVGVPPVTVRPAVPLRLILPRFLLDLAVCLGNPFVVVGLPLLGVLDTPGIPGVGRLLFASPLLLGRYSVLQTPPQAGWRLLCPAGRNRQGGRHAHNANRHEK
jgi:hypothetical protein